MKNYRMIFNLANLGMLVFLLYGIVDTGMENQGLRDALYEKSNNISNLAYLINQSNGLCYKENVLNRIIFRNITIVEKKSNNDFTGEYRGLKLKFINSCAVELIVN